MSDCIVRLYQHKLSKMFRLNIIKHFLALNVEYNMKVFLLLKQYWKKNIVNIILF